MRLGRIAGVAALLLTTIVGTGGPAFATQPGNDTYDGRTVVDPISLTGPVDTTEATSDLDDDALNANCGAPAVDASVWYDVTAGAAGGLVADTSGSDYSAGVIVATGDPTDGWTVVACGPGAVAWETTAGVTYSVLAFDDQMDGSGNGGNLKLEVKEIPPPPAITMTVNPTGTFNTKTGSATVSGTVTCTGVSDFAFVDVQLSQSVGRLIVRGYGGKDIACSEDGTTQGWSVEVLGDNGTFAGGKALSVNFAYACGSFFCGVDFQERIIQLKGGKS